MNNEEIGVDVELDEEEVAIDAQSDVLKGDKGEKGDPGIQGEPGEQGEQGEPGYTPIKGVDYFTNEDIEEIEEDIEAEVITAITPTLNAKANASDVYTKSQVDDELEGKQNKITEDFKLVSDLVDDVSQEHKFVTNADKTNWNAKYDKPVSGIPKTDLASDVQTSLGKADTALQEHQDLTDYVKNTDYATTSKAGIIRAGYGLLAPTINGEAYADTFTYATYQNKSNGNFIGKGTLENVITGKQLVNQTQLNTKADKSSLVTGSGENITLQNTAELEFIQPPLPRGNSEQDGEPSPTNEVLISNVTGDVEVLVRDTKIFDKSTIQAGDIINNNATIRLCSRQEMWIKAGTYTFTTNITSPFRYLVGIENVGVPPISNYPNYIYNSEWQTSSSLTFTINEPGYFTLQLSKTANAQLTVDEVMNFDYELSAHQEQTLPLTLGDIELCKIGTAQDYFYKENNKWYLYKAINKVEITAENVDSLVTGQSVGYNINRVYINKTSLGWKNSWNTGVALINNYSEAKTTSAIASGKFSLNNGSSTLEIYDDRFTDLATARQLMIGTIIYIVLATPTSTEITDTTLISQLDAISNATSYNEQTNISGTSDESNPLFSVQAVQYIEPDYWTIAYVNGQIGNAIGGVY